jgi:chromosome segregation ATPase
MKNVQRQADDCESNFKQLTNLVNELQSKENRNDDFMRDLLQKAEKLESFKVELDEYN